MNSSALLKENDPRQAFLPIALRMVLGRSQDPDQAERRCAAALLKSASDSGSDKVTAFFRVLFGGETPTQALTESQRADLRNLIRQAQDTVHEEAAGKRLRSALGQLSAPLRAVLELRFVQAMSLGEIATALHIDPEQVEAREYASLEKLWPAWKQNEIASIASFDFAHMVALSLGEPSTEQISSAMERIFSQPTTREFWFFLADISRLLMDASLEVKVTLPEQRAQEELKLSWYALLFIPVLALLVYVLL